jgi:hypothetical protein
MWLRHSRGVLSSSRPHHTKAWLHITQRRYSLSILLVANILLVAVLVLVIFTGDPSGLVAVLKKSPSGIGFVANGAASTSQGLNFLFIIGFRCRLRRPRKGEGLLTDSETEQVRHSQVPGFSPGLLCAP